MKTTKTKLLAVQRTAGLIAMAAIISFGMLSLSLTSCDNGSTSSAKLEPAAGDFNIGNLSQREGSVTPVTVTPQEGKSPGDITVYYNGSTTLPSAAGNYAVTFDVAAAKGWKAAEGLSAGTLAISAAPNPNLNTAALTAKIGEANTAKNSVTEAASAAAVPQGQKWATAAQLTTLNNAIAAAETAKSSATTQAAIDSAVTTLNNAVTAFNAAVTANGPGTSTTAVAINHQAIEGVTAPATGGTPATSITAHAQFTGTVTWSPAVSGTFAADTAYTATITLTAATGYTLQGVAANFFTVAGTSAAATNAANSGVITAAFPRTGAAPNPNLNTAALTAKITEAETAKADINEAANAAAVPQGQKWATTAQLATLNNAIAAAETAKSSATTQAAIDSAVTTLNNAVTAFNTAVTNNGSGTATGPVAINHQAIEGVTIPATGGAPATSITAHAQFTGTVIWTPAVSGTFAADTAYTATITLTAATGYTLQGVAADFFTVAGATTVNNPANSGTVTAVFPQTAGGGTGTELTGTVTVTGIARVGQELTADTSGVDGSGAIHYQWQRATAATGGTAADIAGANDSAAYVLAADDADNYICVTVTREGYSGSLTSLRSARVLNQQQYEMILEPSTDFTFTPENAVAGHPDIVSYTVTARNIGYGNTGVVNVNIMGTGAAAFEVTPATWGTMQPDDTRTFTVTTTKYAKGEENIAYIEVKGSNITDAPSFEVKFTARRATVTFNTNGGSSVDPQDKAYGDKVDNAAPPNRDDYTFIGWYKEADFITEWNFDDDTLTDATTIFAKWHINQYTVKYDSNAPETTVAITGSTADSSHSYNVDAGLTANGFSHVGYDFDGWNTRADGSGTAYADEAEVKNLGATEPEFTLYAQWKIKEYTVSFDSDGGSAVANQTVGWNTTTSKPEDPTKTYYALENWYKEEGLTNVWDFDTDPVTEDITLYAKWELRLTSIDEISGYLSSATQAGTAAEPIPLPIKIDLGNMTSTDSGWQQLLTAINTAGKYVELDLNDCTMDGTVFNPMNTVSTGKDKIVAITLPEAGRTIGGAPGVSFTYFTNLASVTIPDGYTAIPTIAFQNCTGLTSVTIPASVTSIGNAAFMGCTGLTSVTFERADTTFISTGNISFPNAASLQTAYTAGGIGTYTRTGTPPIADTVPWVKQ